MGKSVIRVSCADQVLKITEAPVVAAGGLNEVSVEFSFCQKWDGFVKTATFYRDEEEVYYAILDENDTCLIPWEVYYDEGTFYFGVFGEKDDIRRTSNVVKYKVKKGAITSDMMPSNPTPGAYEQIIKMIEELTAEDVGATPASHAADTNNPHGVTTEQIGAASKTEVQDMIDEALEGFDGGGTDGATVSSISITESVDGSVTMVNTLSDGSTETIVIPADTEGNPSGLTYNGVAIPLTYTKEQG